MGIEIEFLPIGADSGDAVAKRHQLNMGGRDGYEASIAEPFKSEVNA